jgi:multiple antibiotic resistance protein
MGGLTLDTFWQSLAGLIVLVGPWKASIVFAEQTTSMDIPTRRRTGLLTVLIATIVGAVFIIIGEPLLEMFHISDAAFLIAAGLIVIVFSIQMVISDDEPARPSLSAQFEGRALRLAIYPLSVPLVITPPGMASLIALGVLAHQNEDNLLPVLAAFAVVMVINLTVFMLESQFEDKINPAVYQVAGRILGVLLVAFGVSIAIDGLKAIDVIR